MHGCFIKTKYPVTMFENDIVQVGALSKAMVYATHFNTSVSTTLNKSVLQIKQKCDYDLKQSGEICIC